MSSHSSRASDGSRPAGDMSRRTGTRVGAAVDTAAGENMSTHSSKALDGSKAADDTGQKSEVSAGVGPIIKNRDRAELIRMDGTRYSTLQQKRGRSDRPGRPSKRFFRAKTAAGEVHDEVVAAVAGQPRAVATAETEIRVEVAAVENAVEAPVVPAVVATAAVADLMAAVGNATGEATSRRSAPRRRVASLPSVLGTRDLATIRAHAHRTRRC